MCRKHADVVAGDHVNIARLLNAVGADVHIIDVQAWHRGDPLRPVTSPGGSASSLPAHASRSAIREYCQPGGPAAARPARSPRHDHLASCSGRRVVRKGPRVRIPVAVHELSAQGLSPASAGAGLKII
jgi:hypothetical protein